jgi:hypothetical protein
MGKIRILAGLALVAWLGCSSFDDNYEPKWDDDDDSASGDDDDLVGDDDDDDVGDDDDAAGEPVIRVDPTQILMQVEVMSKASHDLRIFNDGTAELIVVGLTQLINPSGIDGATYSSAIPVGEYDDVVHAIQVDCHTTGLLNDTLRLEHNDIDQNPTDVSVTIECIPAK